MRNYEKLLNWHEERAENSEISETILIGGA